jgi:acetoin utilization deacetylase AcuC-like enzyme
MRFHIERSKVPVYANGKYSAPSIEFETIKKAVKIAEWIQRTPELRERLELRDPAIQPTVFDEAIVAIEHFVDPEYLAAIRDGEPHGLATSNGLGWDPALYDMVVNSTAGILSALRDVQKGDFAAASLSSGLHHASPSRGSGYCTVNSLAIAALVAASRGLRVVILDLDAHCGGGTNAYLRKFGELSRLISQIDLSVNSFDRYDPRETGSWLELAHEDSYLQALKRALDRVATADPDVVFYNAGVDIWPTVSPDIVCQRDRMVADELRELGTRCVIVMAGGYGKDEHIIPLHLATLTAFADHQAASKTSLIRCADCGGKLLPVVYGYPSSTTMERYSRGEIRLGGCTLVSGQPTSKCRSCGRSSGWRF